MILISRVISIIFQKNRLCTNKIRVIYICPNCDNFLPENFQFLLYFLGGATAPHARLARAPMGIDEQPLSDKPLLIG